MELIDRQAAIEIVRECFRYGWYCEETVREMEKLPTIEERKTMQWIPCSEGMPNEYGEYMFTWVTSYTPNKRFIGVAEYEVTDEWDAINGRWNGRWLFDDYMQSYPNVKVLAWMPLPKPWKGETDG